MQDSGNKIFWFLFTLTASSIILRLYFAPGHTLVLDGVAHTAQSQMVYQSISHGEVPIWSNQWYSGFPLLQFYSPLFFYLSAVGGLLLGDITLSIKLVLFLAQIFSGLTAYLLVLELTDNPRAATIGGLAYALAPWHTYQIIIFGRFPVAMVYTFLPLPFLFLEKYRNGRIKFKHATILIGVSISLLIATHYGYALFASMIFFLYWLLTSLSITSPFIPLSQLKLLLSAAFIAFILSCWLIIPVLFEAHHVSGVFGMFDSKGFALDLTTIKALFSRVDIQMGHTGYIGIFSFLLSLLGVSWHILQRRLAIPIMYAFCFFLLLGHSFSIYGYIPFIYTQLNTERLIIYQLLFMAILAGGGYTFLEKKIARWIHPFIHYILIGSMLVVLLLDLSIAFRVHWPDDVSVLNQSLTRQLERSRIPAPRFMMVAYDSDKYWDFDSIIPVILSTQTHLATLQGSFHQGAGPVLPFLNQLINQTQDLINKNQDLSKIDDAFRLMYLPFVFYLSPQDQLYVHFASPISPVLVAPKLEEWPGEPHIVPLSHEMRIDPYNNSARIIYIPQGNDTPIEVFDSIPKLTVLEYDQSITNSWYKIRLFGPGYLHIAHSYYPYLEVTLDGKEVSYWKTATGFLALSCPEGEHQLRIRPRLSGLRLSMLLLSLLGVVAATVWYRK